MTRRPLSKLFLTTVLGTVGTAVLLTVLGVLFDSRRLTAVGGLLLLVPLAVGFVLAEGVFRLVKHLARPDSQNRLVSFVASLPLQTALVLRGIAVIALTWMVDIYASLLGGEDEPVSGTIRANIAKSAASLGLASYDSIKGRSIHSPGVASRVLATYGYFETLQSFLIFGLALFAGDHTFRMTRIVLDDPFWFLMRLPRDLAMSHLAARPSSITTTLFWYFVGPLGALTMAIALIREDHPEAKACGVGLLVLAVWVFSLPLYATTLILAR